MKFPHNDIIDLLDVHPTYNLGESTSVDLMLFELLDDAAGRGETECLLQLCRPPPGDQSEQSGSHLGPRAPLALALGDSSLLGASALDDAEGAEPSYLGGEVGVITDIHHGVHILVRIGGFLG